jgi:hypothetical protein
LPLGACGGVPPEAGDGDEVAEIDEALVGGIDTTLRPIVARPSEGAGLVRRARVILLSARGVSGGEIALRLDRRRSTCL